MNITTFLSKWRRGLVIYIAYASGYYFRNDLTLHLSHHFSSSTPNTRWTYQKIWFTFNQKYALFCCKTHPRMIQTKGKPNNVLLFARKIIYNQIPCVRWKPSNSNYHENWWWWRLRCRQWCVWKKEKTPNWFISVLPKITAQSIKCQWINIIYTAELRIKKISPTNEEHCWIVCFCLCAETAPY